MIARGPLAEICVTGELLDQASDNKDRNLGHVTDSSSANSCSLSPGIRSNLSKCKSHWQTKWISIDFYWLYMTIKDHIIR